MNADAFPGRSPREEAERLVATALAAASVAARSATGFATGSAECCACPVCRALAAVRDPSPELAERLASGVGDIAVGLAGVLRAFSVDRPATTASRDTVPDDAVDGDAGDGDAGDGDSTAPGGADVWRAATRATPSRDI